MIINLTLLLQIINFFFAYLLLRVFFFVPVLKFIKQDQQRKNMIEQVVLGLEEQVVSVKKKQQKQQDMLRLYFVSHKPNLPESIIHSCAPVLDKLPQKMGDQEVYAFKEQLKSVLQKKLRL